MMLNAAIIFDWDDMLTCFFYQMKLEKKRSASMDKISNKLRTAEMKAQAMRDVVSDQPRRNSRKGISVSCCTYLKIRSLRSCFVCKKR